MFSGAALARQLAHRTPCLDNDRLQNLRHSKADQTLPATAKSRTSNGNRTEQTDEAGHRTTVDYDDANRAVTRREGVDGGDVRVTQSTYDALGHVLTETVGEGSQTRRREYRYDDPAYRRTHERRELIDEQGSHWLETVTTYDGNGNAIATTDALNRTTTRGFDERDRLVQETAPLGKVTTYTYDGRDAVRTETRSNAGGSGAQVRERRYDDDGRLVTEIDANGIPRTRTYDAVGNLIQHSDGRGNTTSYRYDARRNRTYDDHDRPLATTDDLGPVETRTYWPDGLLKSMADADGRTTFQFHDSLHRLVREDLPGDVARTRTFTHTIHGEVLTETDPRGGVTQFAYDSPAQDLDAVTATSMTPSTKAVRANTSSSRQPCVAALPNCAHGTGVTGDVRAPASPKAVPESVPNRA